ncbi:MAG: hypothetical protein U5J62_09190 [Desulfurivibrio sp.]|nr:hypothetical protein [Desulfurivibrio sp.]
MNAQKKPPSFPASSEAPGWAIPYNKFRPLSGPVLYLPEEHEQESDDLRYLLVAQPDFECQLDHGHVL